VTLKKVTSKIQHWRIFNEDFEFSEGDLDESSLDDFEFDENDSTFASNELNDNLLKAIGSEEDDLATDIETTF
jgi:hypothetical protein